MWRLNLIKEIADQSNWIISSDIAIVIADKYPKGQNHFLVLPKAEISSIYELSRDHLPLLEELHLLASNIVEVRGLQWPDFKVGFHAAPSMERLHLHVISQDYVSPALKHKKHWNCFNTELFVPYAVLRDKLKADNCIKRLPENVVQALLATPLRCNQCDYKPKYFPELKEHLAEHLQNKSKSGQYKSVIYTEIETSKDKRNTMDARENNQRKKEHVMENIRNELKKKINDKEHVLIESDQAVVVKADYPKAQYHFRVVPKEDIADVTKLTSDHLPLLDHLMDLAVQIIEKQQHLPSRNFRIGFKADPFWNRLNLHVISDDFYSLSMKRIKHWNSFNTELFMPFQQAYIMLSSEGAIEPLPEEQSEKLKEQLPLRCNQCDFESPLLLSLKAHLFTHWQQKESERQTNKQLDNIVQLLDAAKLEDTAKPEAASPLEQPTVSAGASEQHPYGPPVNLMNQQSINNPFRATPPRFGIAAAPIPPRAGNPLGYGPRPQRHGNPFARAPRPQQGGYPSRYAPRPQQGGRPTRPYGNPHGNMHMTSGPMPQGFPPSNLQGVMDFSQLNLRTQFAPNQQQYQHLRAPNQQQNQRPRAPNQQQNQRPRFAPNQQQNQRPRAPNQQQNQRPRAPSQPENQPPPLTYDPNKTDYQPKNKPKYNNKKKQAANAPKPATK